MDEEQTGRGIILRSADDGTTWSKHEVPLTNQPFAAGTQAGLWGHILEMPDGRLMCGVYGRPKPRARYINGVVESRDGGKTWRYLSHLCDDSSLGNEGCDEMDLVLLDSGDLLSLFRTGTKPTSHMYQVRSTDVGRTWSKARDLGIVGVSPQLLLLKKRACWSARSAHVTSMPWSVGTAQDANGQSLC